MNRVMIRPITKKTPYDLFNREKHHLSHFRSFGYKCFVHNSGKRNLLKFDERSDEAVFLGYALNSKAYRVYNKRTMCVEESVHVIFDETDNEITMQELDDWEIGLARNEDQDEEPPISHKQHNLATGTDEQVQEEPEVPERAAELEEPQELQVETPEELSNEDTQSPVPVRSSQPKPWKYMKSHPVDPVSYTHLTLPTKP